MPSLVGEEVVEALGAGLGSGGLRQTGDAGNLAFAADLVIDPLGACTPA